MNQRNTFSARLRSLRRNAGRRPTIYPLREWVTCLIISLICAVGLIGHAAFDFHAQLNESQTPEVSGEQIPRYRPEEAELILRYYEGRAKTFDAFKANTAAALPIEVKNTEELQTDI